MQAEQQAIGVVERIDQERPEYQQHHNEDGGDHPVARAAKGAEGRGDRYQREDRGDHDDGIEADPCPVAPAEVKPESELIEGEGEPNSETGRRVAGATLAGVTEEEKPPNDRQEEDPDVQVMDVGPAEVQVEQRDAVSQKEDRLDPREAKSQQESDQDAPLQPQRRLAGFRMVHGNNSRPPRLTRDEIPVRMG